MNHFILVALVVLAIPIGIYLWYEYLLTVSDMHELLSAGLIASEVAWFAVCTAVWYKS